MSSSSRVVRQPAVGQQLRIAAPDPAMLDPVVRARVEEASRRAYAQGHAEGVAEGRRTAFDEGTAIAEVIQAGANEASQRLAHARAMRAHEVVSLAVELARAVLGREPHDGGIALLERIRTALEQIDDEPLTVRVNPADLMVVAQGLSGVHGLELVEDGALAPGDARIHGPWVNADLSAAAALERLREVFDD